MLLVDLLMPTRVGRYLKSSLTLLSMKAQMNFCATVLCRIVMQDRYPAKLQVC
jgi:hypothetical protein